MGNTTSLAIVDSGAEVGVTHLDVVFGMNDHDGSSPRCDAYVEVATVPFFGAPATVALALAGSLAGMVATRRRR